MQAVLFDMDGVLVDSEDYWVEREREELLPGVVPDHDVAVSEITGMNYREIYDYLDDNYETAVSRREFLGLFDDAAHEIFDKRVDLLPGFRKLAARLRGEDVDLALVTSSPPSWIDRVFDRFDLHDEFDAVVSADELDGPGKPEPDVYLHAAEKLGLDPEDCLAVEDSSHGIEAAHRAGMDVVGFRFNGEPGEGPADVYVETPEELREVVSSKVE